MKKLLLCIATSVMAMGAVAQIQVNSNGDLITNNHEIYLRNNTGNKYSVYLDPNINVQSGVQLYIQ